METQATPKAPQRLRSDWLRLLAVSVGLPLVICLVDQWATNAAQSVVAIRMSLPVLFVIQVGLLAVCTGRYVDNILLKGAVFIWSILLVDALAVSSIFFGHGTTMQCMMFALLSGQIGLLTAWGMLNRLPWPVRIPILLVSLLLFVMILLRNSGVTPWRNESELWAVILAIQGAIVVGICAVLRLRGFQIAPVNRDTDEQTASREQFQFSIKHIIFWTTAVAPVLALAKSIDWLLMEAQELYWSVFLGIGMGMVTWVALFAALGSSRQWFRVLLLALGPPAIGLLLRWITSHWTMTWGTSSSAWLFIELREFGYGWVLWSALAAWFLAALLLFFRASGYQLVRVRLVATR